jgi:hypothetical protein
MSKPAATSPRIFDRMEHSLFRADTAAFIGESVSKHSAGSGAF